MTRRKNLFRRSCPRILNGVLVQPYEKDINIEDVSLRVEAGITGYTRDPEDSRAYIHLQFRKGDVCLIPVTDKVTGRMLGFDIYAGGSSTLQAVTDALVSILERLEPGIYTK